MLCSVITGLHVQFMQNLHKNITSFVGPLTQMSPLRADHSGRAGNSIHCSVYCWLVFTLELCQDNPRYYSLNSVKKINLAWLWVQYRAYKIDVCILHSKVPCKVTTPVSIYALWPRWIVLPLVRENLHGFKKLVRLVLTEHKQRKLSSIHCYIMK